MRERRGLGRLGAALLAALGLTAAAAAQTAVPDLNHLALEWARGDFRSPLVCEIDGTPRLGLRRVTIAPGPATLERPAAPLRSFAPPGPPPPARRPPPGAGGGGGAGGPGWGGGGGGPARARAPGGGRGGACRAARAFLGEV